MTDRRWVRLVFVAVLACALPIQAASQSRARFELFNECRPFDLVVEGLSSSAAALNLREEDIRTLGESRLRAARLFSDDELWPYLYINVTVSRQAFSATVGFYKELFDPMSGGRSSARTWVTGSTGMAGGSGGDSYIMQTLSQHVDRFVLEYLRVNENACRGRWGLEPPAH